MTISLEDRLSDVLDRQARALEPPAWHPADGRRRPLVTTVPAVTDLSARRSARLGRDRRRLWLATAAAVALTGGAVAVLAPRPDLGTGPPADGNGPGPAGAVAPFVFETPQVRLEADAITVEADGRTFTPAVDVDVSGDPGVPEEYTTLELTWREQGVEMRINLYFSSDGSDWWLSEARVYNGRDPGDWQEEQMGPFLQTPLGQAYEGDVDLGPLHLGGLRLEAFPADERCLTTDQSGTEPDPERIPQLVEAGTLRLVSTASNIEIPDGASGYGYRVLLLDLERCTQLSVDGTGVSIEATVADPDMLASDPVVSGGHIDLSIDRGPVAAGTTSLHVVARLDATGQEIDAIDVPIVIDGP